MCEGTPSTAVTFQCTFELASTSVRVTRSQLFLFDSNSSAIGAQVHNLARYTGVRLSVDQASTTVILTDPSLLLSFGSRGNAVRFAFAIRLAANRNPALSRASFRVITTLGSDALGSSSLVEHLADSSVLCMRTIPRRLLLSDSILGHMTPFVAPCSPFIAGIWGSFSDDGSDCEILLSAYPTCGSLVDAEFESPAHFRRCVAELCLAIECCRSVGLTLGDLRPENVLMDAAGHVVVADFALGVGPSAPGSEATDDWFSVGALMCTALLGVPPPASTESLCEDARNLISLFVGPNEKGSQWLAQIKTHRFFNGIDWQAVADKSLNLPGKQPLDALYAKGSLDPPVGFDLDAMLDQIVG